MQGVTNFITNGAGNFYGVSDSTKVYGKALTLQTTHFHQVIVYLLVLNLIVKD